jgi:predicted nucleotidyltransferase
MIESLFGKTKRKILGLFFLNSDKQYYFSEVIRAAGIRQGAVQRELKSLVASGLLNAEIRGRQTFYSVNKANAIYEELRSIMFKTYAVGDVLVNALKPFKRKIAAAFIYGSVAKGTDTGQSDIDLFVIGQVTFGDLSVAMSPHEGELGRAVNMHSFTPKEFAAKIGEGNHFVSSVIRAEKIFLIGSEDDIRGMAIEQVAQKRANQRKRNSRSVSSP